MRLRSRARPLLQLTEEPIGFPRHLSQHAGGFVPTQGPLARIVPIENASMPERTVIEWDKDDLDALGLPKVDCLALGMLSAIVKSLPTSASRRATASSCRTSRPRTQPPTTGSAGPT